VKILSEQQFWIDLSLFFHNFPHSPVIEHVILWQFLQLGLAMVSAGNVISGCLVFFGIWGVGIGVGILEGFNMGFLGLGFLGFLVLGFLGLGLELITTLFGILGLFRAPKIITKITMRNKQ